MNEIKFKDKESQIDHVTRLTNAICFGNGFVQFKNHWCDEHQCMEY